ncbi:MAG TPA: molybdopterin-dependent oxidoreductase [Gemmataceae bacterium]|nr:molybdopterin-dependent oxidoreductase [Gemmataceae bacterium]
MHKPISRRGVLQSGIAGLAAGLVADNAATAQPSSPPMPPAPPFVTPARDFQDVSRGNPLPHSLRGGALVQARLTAETWRLEILAEDGATLANPKRLDDGTALDFAALVRLGARQSVRFLKAMQCNNIQRPLGQGLWEGVPLRELLRLCGRMDNPRRLYYWGFHNNDAAQVFRSSLAMNQVLDSPPGELVPFVAYRLNGAPIPLERGGPVRMVVPWAHGFKSVKWLQRITLTNNHQANDTYAERNNDPESYLKTAAYFDNAGAERFPAGRPVVIRGRAMVGWPGLERVEYWIRPAAAGDPAPLPDDSPELNTARWQPCVVEPAPTEWTNLPDGVLPRSVHGFTAEGRPREWPIRFTYALWSLRLTNVPAGRHELRVRTVDKNGFAQPEPRPLQRSGLNRIQRKIVEIAG